MHNHVLIITVESFLQYLSIISKQKKHLSASLSEVLPLASSSAKH